MRIGITIALSIAVAILAQAASTQKSPWVEERGQFADLDALPKPKSAESLAAASNAAPARAFDSRKDGASFVSNVLAVAAASTTNAVPGAGLNGYVPDDKYKLRVGDRVSFQILEDRDAPKSLVVADSGELDIPYVGRVPVVDKTCKQLANDLKTQLEKEYYYRATVVLALDVANKVLGRIYVWGQVKSQGPIDLAVNENLTAGKAILRAGGFSDFANKKRVKVIRGSGTEGPGKQSFELNLVEILEKGLTEKDVILQPDDSIIVPAKLVNF